MQSLSVVPNLCRLTPLIALVVCIAGCRTGGPPDARYRQLSQDIALVASQPPGSISVASPRLDHLAAERTIEELIVAGLRQNTEIQEAQLMVESLANRVPQVASLPDPLLAATVFPSPVQTAAGQQEFALGLNQKVPWRGKLDTRAAMAQQDVIAARARLAAVELKVVQQIRNACFQLYFVQQALQIINEDRSRRELMVRVINQTYQVNPDISQQDLLQIEVALKEVDTEILQLEQQQISARARLARLLHVSPDTPFAIRSLPPQQTVNRVQELYETAIQCRPELHAQLAEIGRDRRASSLAELQNRPDMTWGFNWIGTSSAGISPVANGDDAFMLTLGMNLPVYRKRIDAGVREARTRALASARKYERLRDETLESVADLFARIESLQATRQLFVDEIIPKQELTFNQSVADYQVNKVDFQQMVGNWQKLLRYRIEDKQLQARIHQTLASLSRQIGQFDLEEQDHLIFSNIPDAKQPLPEPVQPQTLADEPPPLVAPADSHPGKRIP